jgi:hypothetical protein
MGDGDAKASSAAVVDDDGSREARSNPGQRGALPSSRSDAVVDIFDMDRVDAEDLDEGEDDTEHEAQPSDADTRPILIIEGEGTARELFRIVRQLTELRAVIEPVWVAKLANRDRMAGTLSAQQQQRVVACWRQVGARPRVDAAREQEPPFPGARVVSFARISMELLWPLTGTDPRRVPEPPVYKQSRYGYADQVGAQLAGLDLDDDELFDYYMEQSTQAMPDLGLWYDNTVADWRQREAGADIRMVDELLAEFAEHRLFHSPGAPTGRPLISLVRRLLDTLDDLGATARERCHAEHGQLNRG